MNTDSEVLYQIRYLRDAARLLQILCFQPIKPSQKSKQIIRFTKAEIANLPTIRDHRFLKRHNMVTTFVNTNVNLINSFSHEPITERNVILHTIEQIRQKLNAQNEKNMATKVISGSNIIEEDLGICIRQSAPRENREVGETILSTANALKSSSTASRQNHLSTYR